MEKLSLFDLLAFAIPGAAVMALIHWVVLTISPLQPMPMVMPEVLLAALLLMFAYFLGHLISEFGVKLEKWMGGSPHSWVKVLEVDPGLAQSLNLVSKDIINLSFLSDEGKVDPVMSGKFYDYAFHILEIENKLEKVRTLQSQYVFFRNTSAVALLGGCSFLLVILTQWFKLGFWNIPGFPFLLLGLSMFSLGVFQARRLSFKRREMKMKATLLDFHAFMIVETKIKK